ncbi:MAG: hypothetical protein GY906_08560, partial [bacterium]|nr:hypothetical protein [bacterium]
SLGYQVLESRDSQIGADFKWGITSDLTLDLTVNTDFAQVEADDAVVNLSRFSIFQPEKRLFFQERAGVFDFGTGGFNRLFYSRRIGIDDDGALVPILGGIRVVGRVGEWDVGALNMQTDSTEAVSSENMGVVRVRRQAFNSGSYIGGMATTRIDRDGSSNIAYGLDSVVRFERGDELTVRWAQTFDQEPGAETSGGIDSSRLYAAMTRRNRNGWGYSAITGYCGPNYNPGLGFNSRDGFTQLYGELRHGVIADENKWYRTWNRWVDGGAYWRTDDKQLDSGHFGFGTNFQTRASAWMWADLRGYTEDLVDSFEMANGVEVPEGNYSWVGLSAGFNLPRGRNIHLWGNGYIGQFYDGNRFTIRLGPEWTASRHLTFGLRYELNALRFPTRQESADIHLAQLRFRWSLNSKLSADLYSQLSSEGEMVATNLRVRYNFREGTDLYVVLNESVLTNRLQDGVMLPRSNGRTFIVKYSHTLSL